MPLQQLTAEINSYHKKKKKKRKISTLIGVRIRKEDGRSVQDILDGEG